MKYSSKIVTNHKELLKKRRAAKKCREIVVFTNGCFDLLHPGHTRYLKDAKALGDHLIVAINSDKSVRTIKGAGRPIQSEQARAEVLAALEAVDWVTLFDEETRLEGSGNKVCPSVHKLGSEAPTQTLPV